MVERNVRTGAIFPDTMALRNARLWVERRCVKHARALVYCTEGARQIAVRRYPDADPAKSTVIPNGFEEDHFRDIPPSDDASSVATRPLTLLHSGTVYASEDRDPTRLFDAIAALQQADQLSGKTLKVMFRASGATTWLKALIDDRRIGGIVELVPPIPYREALAEMVSVDGLLILQGYTSNPAIPAKLYEYLRAGKPILALVDRDGDTAGLLRRLHVGRLCSIEDISEIASGLSAFMSEVRSGRSPVLATAAASEFSRERAATDLARLFDRIIANPRCGRRSDCSPRPTG
jgi:glycosyltransferase involved in cell wall biosynthesis